MTVVTWTRETEKILSFLYIYLSESAACAHGYPADTHRYRRDVTSSLSLRQQLEKKIRRYGVTGSFFAIFHEKNGAVFGLEMALFRVFFCLKTAELYQKLAAWRPLGRLKAPAKPNFSRAVIGLEQIQRAVLVLVEQIDD